MSIAHNHSKDVRAYRLVAVVLVVAAKSIGKLSEDSGRQRRCPAFAAADLTPTAAVDFQDACMYMITLLGYARGARSLFSLIWRLQLDLNPDHVTSEDMPCSRAAKSIEAICNWTSNTSLSSRSSCV